jgi:hypothetical protein
MSTGLRGFNVEIRDGQHRLQIQNTESTGCVTIKDSASPLAFNINEEDFIRLARILKNEADKIEEKMRKARATGHVVIEEEEPTTAAAKEEADGNDRDGNPGRAGGKRKAPAKNKDPRSTK